MSSAPYGLDLQDNGGAMMSGLFHPEQFYSASSFTPLNPRPPMGFINPNDVLHYPNNDPSIYDIPQDDDDEALNEVPEQPAKKSRKRPSMQARQGRQVSLGAVWNYTDEEDMVFEVEEETEVLAPSKPVKRAKSAPANKKAKKAPYKIQNSEHDEEQPLNSQLTTTPDSTRGKARKGCATTSKGKKGRLPSFRNLTITKAIQPQGEEVKEPIETPSAVISYQGWTSTQNSAKHVTLTQTTLDKLAAFRYNPAPSKPIPQRTPIDHESPTQGRVDDIEQGPASTILEGNNSLNGWVFTPAVWNTEVDDPFVTEQVPEHSQHENAIAEHDQDMDHPEAAIEVPISTINQPAVGPEEDALQPFTTFEFDANNSDEACQHYPPTSSEALATRHVEDVAHGDKVSVESQGGMLILPAVIPNVRTFEEEQVAQDSGGDAIEANPYSIKQTVQTDYNIDEFDDGLDDEDLMAIDNDELTLNEPTVVVLPAAVKPSSFMGVAHTSLGISTVPHLSLIDMDSDYDEYPMDASDDERMLKLAEYTDLVVEKHHAPSSLQNEIDFQDEYDSALQFSPPPPPGANPKPAANNHSDLLSQGYCSQDEFEDWAFMSTELDDVMRKVEAPNAPATEILSQSQNANHCKISTPKITANPKAAALVLDDSHEYTPLDRFARPEFPGVVRDRCPIVGVSAQSFLRVCFRIGELFQEGARCSATRQDAVIELFARVNFSSREAGTTKQHFRFMDLWSEHPPFPTGILANYKSSSLADSESLFFVGDMGKGEMVRCLGRLKKEKKSDTGWIFEIINVRGTDWEEIRWTKRIVEAGAERGLSKL